MQYLWTSGGTFFGYREEDSLFTHQGKCVGRFQGDEIYGSRGEYLGEIEGSGRLITDKSKKSLRGEQASNAQGDVTGKLANYTGYVMLAGYEDFPDPDTL